MYLWVNKRWYFFVGILDASSRYIVHWDLLESATSADLRTVIESALKKYPSSKPIIVTDNGPLFKSIDFRVRALIKEFPLMDIKTRIKHPDSNEKIERFNKSLREEALSEKDLKNKYKACDIINDWWNITIMNDWMLHLII